MLDRDIVKAKHIGKTHKFSTDGKQYQAILGHSPTSNFCITDILEFSDSANFPIRSQMWQPVSEHKFTQLRTYLHQNEWSAVQRSWRG